MQFAAIGSCGGAAATLRATLDAIEEAGVLTIVQTGEVLGAGADVNECIELLRERGVACAQGELDRLLLRFEQKQATLERKLAPEVFQRLATAHAAITSEHLEFVRGLPKRHRFELDRIHVLVCHGSPTSQREVLDGDAPLPRLQRLREMEPPDIMVCGGAPLPWSRLVDGSLFVGPGDLPPEGWRYALVSTEENPWRMEVQEEGAGQ